MTTARSKSEPCSICQTLIEGFKALLKGGTVVPANQPVFSIRRALPHGHVAAVLCTLRRIGLDRMLGPAGNRCRNLVIAMIVARLVAPSSKLATPRDQAEVLLRVMAQQPAVEALDQLVSISRLTLVHRIDRLDTRYVDERLGRLETKFDERSVVDGETKSSSDCSVLETRIDALPGGEGHTGVDALKWSVATDRLARISPRP